MANFKSKTFRVINPLNHDIPSSGIKAQPSVSRGVNLSRPGDNKGGYVKHVSAGRFN